MFGHIQDGPFSRDTVTNLTICAYERQIERGLSHDEAMCVLHNAVNSDKARQLTDEIISLYLTDMGTEK